MQTSNYCQFTKIPPSFIFIKYLRNWTITLDSTITESIRKLRSKEKFQEQPKCQKFTWLNKSLIAFLSVSLCSIVVPAQNSDRIHKNTIEIYDQKVEFQSEWSIGFPIGNPIGSYFRSDFPSDFCQLSDQILSFLLFYFFIFFKSKFPIGNRIGISV